MKPKHLTLALFALTISAVTLTAGCGQEETPEATPTAAQPSETPTAQPTEGLLTHESPEHGISIKYPADWTKDEEVEGAAVVFFAPSEGASDVFLDNVNIIVQDLSGQPTTLDEFTESTLGQIEQNITDPNILDSSAATLAGNPAHKLIFTGKHGNYDLKWMEVWTIKNDKAYMISYTAEVGRYPALLGDAEQMIDSFQIT
jgi:hypothetical protein